MNDMKAPMTYDQWASRRLIAEKRVAAINKKEAVDVLCAWALLELGASRDEVRCAMREAARAIREA